MQKTFLNKLVFLMVVLFLPLLSQADTFTDNFANLNYVDTAQTDAFYDAAGQRFMLPPGTTAWNQLNVPDQANDVAMPKVVFDANNNPIIAWVNTDSDRGIFLARLVNGTWTKMDGDAGADVITNTSSTIPSLQFRLDSNGYPILVWSESGDVRLTRWSGSAWVKMDGSAGIDMVENMSEYISKPRFDLDENNYPIVTWSVMGNIFLTRWSGSAWVKMDGSAGIDTLPVTSPTYSNPKVVIGSDNHPLISCTEWGTGTEEILLTRWSGSAWVKMDGSPGFDNVTNGEASVSGNGDQHRIILDSSQRPVIVWSDGSDIRLTRWSGSAWVKMDGSAGIDNVSNSGNNALEAQIILDSNGNPMVVWSDGSDIRLTRWSGSAWVKMDGSAGTEVVSDNGLDPHIAIDSNNNPLVTWTMHIPDLPGLLFIFYNRAPYQPEATLQSKNILNTTQTIDSVTLTAADEKPNETNILYDISLDGGTTWEAVQSGVAFNLPTPAVVSNLVYRARLSTTNGSVTPVINRIAIEYRGPVSAFCGDGIINQPTEQCDDGNTADGDGCSGTCQIEQIPPAALFNISGVVFNDQNQDALYAVGENLYAQVTVDILDEAGNVVATAVTNNQGLYSFTVAAGKYLVKVTDTNNILSNLTATTPKEINLNIDRNLADQNFGYYLPIPAPIPNQPEDKKDESQPKTDSTCSGFIGDTIWLDENGNGKEDKNEKGIKDIRLKLKWAGEDGKWNTKDDKEFKTDTNHKGYYKFKNLDKGRYKLKVDEDDIKKEKLIQTYDPSGTVMDLNATINLSCNKKISDADFGFKKEEQEITRTLFQTGVNNPLPKVIFWLTLGFSISLSFWSWRIRKSTRVLGQ